MRVFALLALLSGCGLGDEEILDPSDAAVGSDAAVAADAGRGLRELQTSILIAVEVPAGEDDAGMDLPPLQIEPEVEVDLDAGVDLPAPDAAEPVDAAPAPQLAETCQGCSDREDCIAGHFCWPTNDSNRCLPVVEEGADPTGFCSKQGMDARSLPGDDTFIFCRPLTGDCNEWLLLQ